jgi:hypothetical protein
MVCSGLAQASVLIILNRFATNPLSPYDYIFGFIACTYKNDGATSRATFNRGFFSHASSDGRGS